VQSVESFRWTAEIVKSPAYCKLSTQSYIKYDKGLFSIKCSSQLYAWRMRMVCHMLEKGLPLISVFKLWTLEVTF
jgi:hypothetical protein